MGHDGLVDFSGGCKRSCDVDPYALAQCADLVDWPDSQRDGFVFTDVNTVVNSYAVGGLDALSRLANASGRPPSDGERLGNAAATIRAAMNSRLWGTGGTNLSFSDGLDTAQPSKPAVNHASFHSASFPLFFDIADSASRQEALLEFLRNKRMAGSVYAAYALLLGLYKVTSDHGALALSLLTSCEVNSWCSMLRVGASATMEAWTRPQKPNLSWSHPWASAPSSAIVRGLMGIQPTAIGFRAFTVRPQPGGLAWASVRTPSLSGWIEARFDTSPTNFSLTLSPPANTMAQVCLPLLGLVGDATLLIDGQITQGHLDGDYACVDGVGSGSKARVIQRIVK